MRVRLGIITIRISTIIRSSSCSRSSIRHCVITIIKINAITIIINSRNNMRICLSITIIIIASDSSSRTRMSIRACLINIRILKVITIILIIL